MTPRFAKHELQKAAELLRAGQVIAFPTETVYGLGADATNAQAVADIFAAKNRPSFNPLIVHVADLAAAQQIAEFDAAAGRLAQAFWPGPMSLVLPLKPQAGICDLVTAGLPSVAVRVPAHPLAQKLLRLTGRPVAAPSANPSGRISPTTADHVLEGLDGKIAGVVDGGPCDVGVESSIFGGTPLALLRPGGVSREAVEQVLGHPLAEQAADGGVTAPGQLRSHYAPDAGLRLNVTARGAVPHLGFGAGASDMTLSATGDLHEAAQNLFAMLRAMDRLARTAGTDHFTVAPVPMVGLGLAINDRLARAAAPR